MPPRKQTPAGPTPVDAIVHADKRANLPLADSDLGVSADVDAPVTLRWPRDPSLDPQLVWKGKDRLDGDDLVVSAPSIYIQEKIDPRVLIEDLRRTKGVAGSDPIPSLFDTFDGLDDLDLVEYYRHDANWSNRMILGDSLEVMASLAERERLRSKIQMIYIDPPYGIKFGSNWQFSVRVRDVKDGRHEDTTREVEQIKAFRDTWELGISSYLSYLRDRLVAAHELLSESGSVFVQIGEDNVHRVRSLLDEVFGSDNFCGHIAFVTTGGSNSQSGVNVLASVFDHLLWYGRSGPSSAKYRQLYRAKEIGGTGGGQYRWIERSDGSRERLGGQTLTDLGDGERIFRTDQIMSSGHRATSTFEFEFEGRRFHPGSNHWKTTQKGMSNLATANRLMLVGNTLCYVRYLNDFAAFPYTNVWSDTVTSGFADPKIYVVQTNTKVIERCMLMTTDPGDLVLDPTCGSGTTSYVAEQWGRRWITIDTSRVALALARQRLMGARFPYFLLTDSEDGRRKEEELIAQQLPPTTPAGDIRMGFVYERVPHITLKSIANNLDLKKKGWRARRSTPL